MEELYRIVGAKFLNDARFHVRVQTPLEMLSPDTYLPKEFIIERLSYEMINRISHDLFKVFQKEIKVKNVGGGFGEQHDLEFFAFPKESFKLMIEYIISEMPETEINRIRYNKI